MNTARTLRHRLGVLGALTTMLSGLVVAVGAGTASADSPCDNPPNLGNAHFVSNDYVGDSIHPVLSVLYYKEPPERIFNRLQSASVTNPFTTPSTATFTSSVQNGESTTITLSTSVTLTNAVEGGLTTAFQESVSVAIQHSITKQIGVSTTVTLPPYGGALGVFGNDAYRIHFELQRWEIGGGKCWWRPELAKPDVVALAPTDTEQAWHPQPYPTVNVGGVVNGTTWQANDIHPGTVVAIFGQYFSVPDQVIVRQGGNRFTIGAGSPAFYDSFEQINATMPGNLQPGSATIAISGGNGLESVAVPITIR